MKNVCIILYSNYGYQLNGLVFFKSSLYVYFLYLKHCKVDKPPISQTFNFKPFAFTLLMLNPCVGEMLSWLSFDRNFRMVVLPALSRPSKRTRSSLVSLRFIFRNKSNSPGCGKSTHNFTIKTLTSSSTCKNRTIQLHTRYTRPNLHPILSL